MTSSRSRTVSPTSRMLHGFDACSLLLFASLTLSGTQAVMAQPRATTSTASPTGPAPAIATPATPATTSEGPAAAPAQPTDAKAWFARADANADGKVTLREAERFPAVSEHFSQFDSDHNGSLSPEEFARSIAHP